MAMKNPSLIDDFPINKCIEIDIHSGLPNFPQFIELDDGKNLTGKPQQFDGKNLWVSG